MVTMSALLERSRMHMVGIALALQALVSLILLSTAVAHCVPRIGHNPAAHAQVTADHSHHGGHHAHAEHSPAAPDPQKTQDACCGVLCRAVAGHAFAPAPGVTRVGPVSHPARTAPAPDERPVLARRRSLIPLGSRAPPIAA